MYVLDLILYMSTLIKFASISAPRHVRQQPVRFSDSNE